MPIIIISSSNNIRDESIFDPGSSCRQLQLQRESVVGFGEGLGAGATPLHTHSHTHDEMKTNSALWRASVACRLPLAMVGSNYCLLMLLVTWLARYCCPFVVVVVVGSEVKLKFIIQLDFCFAAQNQTTNEIFAAEWGRNGRRKEGEIVEPAACVVGSR